MTIEGGQASRRALARSLFDEAAKVKQGCEESEPHGEISEEKFPSDALQEMPGRLAFCQEPTTEREERRRVWRAPRGSGEDVHVIRRILNAPNWLPFN